MPKARLPLIVALALVSAASSATAGPPEAAHLRALQQLGREPLELVLQALDSHDLLIFDDGLHNAAEPWDFYERLLREPRVQKRVRTVFVEVLATSAQPQIDAYLDSPSDDRTLLLRAFQDDYSGYGWRYETCLDLLASVRQINLQRPAAERIRVIGVSPPIYWEALHSRQDYDLFQDSLIARDYSMYATILARLNRFADGAKAFFLTNTRHAYKHLRARDGRLHWNCATFFDQHWPGKAYSIRIHNATLRVEAEVHAAGPASAEGLERLKYSWARMQDGAWDRAFARNGDRPVALPLAGNAFGRAKYVGNTMLDARADQTLADVYDALVFLAPLDQLHESATTGFFYTPEFRRELARRIRLLEGDHLEAMLAQEQAASLDELVERLASPAPRKRSTLLDAPP